MRYAGIHKFDISNGTGIRVCLFVQGCHRHCKGCFNPETWDFNQGKEWSEGALFTLFKLAEDEWVSGLSILGGEPLAEENIHTVIDICRRFRIEYPDKDIWLWTGYTFEEIPSLIGGETLLYYVDKIVDGPFIEEEKDLSLPWRGSKNQRIWERNKEGIWQIKSEE